MADYIVVLMWDTGSDEGEVPAVFQVTAESEIKAIDYAIKKAHDGSLYCLMFNPQSEVEDVEYMEINRDKSFAVEVKRLVRI